MAINKGLKIGLSIAAVGITGTIVYMIIKKILKKKEEEVVIVDGDTPDVLVKTTTTSSTPTSSTPKSLPSIPFTSKLEGNAFRDWINDTYPSYASEINLDRTGSYNNSYINKAWTKYGSLYQVSGVSTNLNTSDSTLTNAYNILTGTTGETAPSGTFNAATSANALYKSMKGFGTDEVLFFNTSNGMTSSQRVLTREYFDNNNIGKGETLCEWIEGEFDWGSETKALKLYGLPTGAGYFKSNCN